MLYLLQLLLCLPKLGQIQSSNLLGILNLLLVSPGLVLKLLYQLIQTFNILLSRSSETHKGAIRADRKIKELQFTSEEEQKNFERLNFFLFTIQT